MRRTTPIKVAAALGAAFGLLTLGLAVGVATPAQAHNKLVSSTPSESEVLTTLPDEFVITTSDALLELGGDSKGFALQVLDADGLYYGDGCVVVDGPSMTAAAALGAPGAYVMRWQAVSIDGHSIDGEIPFGWEPTDISQSSEGSATAPVCGETTEEPAPAPEDAGDEPVAPAPESESDESAISSDLLWIGGAVLAVVIAAGATMLALSRKKG